MGLRNDHIVAGLVFYDVLLNPVCRSERDIVREHLISSVCSRWNGQRPEFVLA